MVNFLGKALSEEDIIYSIKGLKVQEGGDQ